MIKRFICFLIGHDVDWNDYGMNSKKENASKIQCIRCRKYIKTSNVDIQRIKVGDMVWAMYQNRAEKLEVQRIEKIYSGAQVEFIVVSGSFRVPFEGCYQNELDLINQQIFYWQEKRFQFLDRTSLT